VKSDVHYIAPTFRTLRHQFIGLRALRRLMRNLGMIAMSNSMDRLVGQRRAEYWQRPDCESIDLYKYCTRAKHQHVSERDTQLWLDDRR
jgi:hypothetical protein